MGYPSVYPTGTTIYEPEKCWNGYTIFPAKDAGAALIDMNGNNLKLWKGLEGFPAKLLPGGYVMGSTGPRNPKYGYQDLLDLVQVDWDGNIVWSYPKAGMHHDFQILGSIAKTIKDIISKVPFVEDVRGDNLHGHRSLGLLGKRDGFFSGCG